MKISIPGMQTLEGLGATDLVAVVTNYRDLLQANRQRINQLNVYPVPDGDTGTNMALTLDSVVQEIAGRAEGAEPPDLAAVAKAISHGSLMGARGNSGVILSQILRGLAAAFSQAAAADRPIDGSVLVDGLVRARDGAYQAVGNPVEGTILTVVRAAAEAAASVGEATGGTPGLVAVLEAAQEAADLALEGTPELLPALKAAGVVDSGGAGLVLLFPAALHVVDGRALPDPDEAVPASTHPAAGGAGRPDPAGGEGLDPLGELRYEVMYLLEASDDAVGDFRKVWAPTTSVRPSRPPSTLGAPVRSGSPTCGTRWRRSAGCGRRERGTPLRPRPSRSVAPWWPCATATVSGASSTPSG
jgi:dihydroxyacetone kinase-like predicted kinase